MIADEVSPRLDGPAICSTNVIANGDDGAKAPVIDDQILMIARAMGRHIARERLNVMRSDNDNVSVDTPVG